MTPTRFIIAGVPRCGTTLLARALDAGGETRCLDEYVNAFEQLSESLGRGWREALPEAERRSALLVAREELLQRGEPLLASTSDFASIGELHALALRQLCPGGTRLVGHKTVLSPRRIRVLLEQSDLHVILALRDPRDAALSYWHRSASSVERYVEEWRDAARIVIGTTSPRLHRVSYERLVTEPAPLLDALVGDMLGAPAAKGAPRVPRGRSNSAYDDVVRPFDDSPIGRHEKTPDSPVVRYANWACAAEASALGYSLGPVRASDAARFRIRRAAFRGEELLNAGARAVGRRVLRRIAPPVVHR